MSSEKMTILKMVDFRPSHLESIDIAEQQRANQLGPSRIFEQLTSNESTSDGFPILISVGSP